MLKHVNLHNALIVAPVSMAKIEGRQSAQNTVALFTDLFLPYAPQGGEGADVVVVTTEGLYMNNQEGTPYALREKLWDKADAFRRCFARKIVEAQRDCSQIKPEAFSLETFDAHRVNNFANFRALFGFLNNELNGNERYREKVRCDLARMGQPDRPDKRAFLNEEFAWDYLTYRGLWADTRPKTLRSGSDGQIILCYPGVLMESQIEAYRLMSHAAGALPLGRCIYVNTEKRCDQDLAATIAVLDESEPKRQKGQGVKLSYPGQAPSWA